MQALQLFPANAGSGYLRKKVSTMDNEDFYRFTDELFDESMQDVKVDFQSDIDLLFNEVINYRKSERFKAILDFCCNFRHIAPFNAMIINMQRPGAKYALTSKEWRLEYGRRLKPNAQPLIYLNRRPVGTLYDISDTEALFDQGPTDQEILDQVANPFKTEGDFDERLLWTLLKNLQYFGIAYDLEFNSAGRYGAYIEKRPVVSEVCYSQVCFQWEMPYFISINRNAGTLQKMQALCHELGHYFCHHLPPVTSEWWVTRRHDKVIREFEAESTAYMVCKRIGIPCPNSEAYLAGYIADHEYIPQNISVDAIMKSVNSIEKMLKPMTWSEGPLYKDPRFKERIEEERERLGKKRGRN